MRIAVVRHGHAAPKKEWIGADSDRPLTGRGRRQAYDLVQVLDGEPTRLIASPAVRCHQTLEPLAHHWGRDLEVDASLARDSGTAAADLIGDLLSATAGESTIVLCTHREVITKALPLLAKNGGIELDHRLPGAKGGVWLLRYRAGQLDQVRYRAPRS